MEHITSRSNALITRIRKLVAERKHRRREGVMVCEGPKMLGEALRWGAALDTVVWEAGKARAQDIPDGVRQVEVPGDLLAALAPTQTPQGVLFLCQLPARAFGADGMILLPGCADPWSPKTLRATMGACFRLPVWEGALGDLVPKLAQAGLPLYATALREDTVDLREMDLRRCAVTIGSEGRGVSQAVLDASAKTVKIPMAEQCESLNAAIAGAVVLWQMGFGR